MLDMHNAREFFAILGQGDRLHILFALEQNELTVTEIAEATGMTTMKATRLLMRMRVSGILSSRRDCREAFYRISSPAAYRAIELVREEFAT